MSEDPAAAFRVEAGELLAQVEQDLLDLRDRLGDMGLVNAVFRGFHTLKGSGAMFGFDGLAAFTHHCESAFDRVRKGDVRATPELVDVILSAGDHMCALIEGDAPEGEGRAILDRLAAVVDAAAGGTKAGLATTARQGWTLSFRLPADAMANGTNPLALLDELRELGETTIVARTEGVPRLDTLVPSHCYISWDCTLVGDISRDAIEDVFLFVMDDMEITIAPLAMDANAADNVPAVYENASGVAEPPVAASEQADRRPAGRAQGEYVRVPAERLDALMDRVGELVIAQSRLSQLASQGRDLSLRSVSEEIERLAGEMRDTMMVLRMVPVSTLFGRFRRLILDLANETGKAIEMVTEGESTEVDKTVIERLFDPLVHIIRNSCDHGLEPAVERVAAGKTASGVIRLSAHQAGGEVVITIADDGRGIDRSRVRTKAEACGLLQPGQIISDDELLGLIFAPGFSTAATVTNLSGRGVGMDVVKRTIESLRGTIDVRSVDGVGSIITLRIPLTLAIIDGLLVRVGENRYVMPLSAVEECLELTLEDDMRSRGQNLITLRDRLVPFLRLRELFGTDTRPDPHQKIVVVSVGNERLGLVVDQIIGNHQTVIKSMSALHMGVAAFAGATILGDGSVALILDIGQLIATAQPREERLRAAG